MNNRKRSFIAIALTLLVGPGIFNSTNGLGQEPSVAFEPVETKSREQNPVKEAPAVLIRPSVSDLKHINQCVVEINEIPNSKSEIALRLLVPDSVQRIEIVPNRSTSSVRNFRLQLDQGSPLEPIYFGDPPMRPSSSMQSARTQPVSNSTIRQGFKKNPYMQQSVAQLPKFRSASNNDASRSMLQPVFYTEIDKGVSSDVLQASSAAPNPSSFNQLAQAEQPITESAAAPATSFLPPIVSSTDLQLLATQLTGPLTMGVGDIGDFTVSISNPTRQACNHLNVRLDIPEGLSVVIIDREAKLDRDSNTLTWSIQGPQAGEQILIRYRVKSLTQGPKHQQVGLTVDGQPIESCELTTNVQLRYSTSEAPPLQYETGTQ